MRYLRGLILMAGLLGVFLYSEFSSEDASLPNPVYRPSLSVLQPLRELPLPEISIIGPRPGRIRSDSADVAFFFLSFSNAEMVSVTDEVLKLEYEGNVECEKEVLEIGQLSYAIEVSKCRGSGLVSLSVNGLLASNANGESKSEIEISPALTVVGKPRALKLTPAVTPFPVPTPEPTPEPTPAPSPIPKPEVVYVPRADIYAHEVTIARPKSGTIYVRTDLTSYYYQIDDPSSSITFKRPLNGNRFVSVSHISEGGKRILFWRRSDVPGEEFEPNERGEFKIDLIDLTEPKAIVLQPVYSK